MAETPDPREDRPSGWPPEGTGRSRLRPLTSDDLVLTILWMLVVAGLLALLVLALPSLLSWAGRQT